MVQELQGGPLSHGSVLAVGVRRRNPWELGKRKPVEESSGATLLVDCRVVFMGEVILEQSPEMTAEQELGNPFGKKTGMTRID